MEMEENELQDILNEFFTEADEGLDDLEQDLIKLETLSENGEDDPELIDRLFRVVHTLKGGAGFLGLERIAKLAHAGENLMDEVRSHKVAINKDVMDALLLTSDVLKELLEIHKANEDPESIEIEGLVGVLEKLAYPAAGAAATPEAPKEEAPVAPETPVVEAAAPEAPASDVPVNEDLLKEVMEDDRLAAELDADGEGAAEAPAAEAAAPEAPASDVPINEDLLKEVMDDDRLAPELDAEGEAVEAKPAEEVKVHDGEVVDEVKSDAPKSPVNEDGEIEVVRGAAKPPERRDTDRREGQADRRKASRRTQEKAETTIRVETSKLDKTMNLVGELVLARNSMVRQLSDPEIAKRLSGLPSFQMAMTQVEQISNVTRDLQMTVLSTRMQAIRRVFDKIPRQVRELKTKLGREVDLIIEGETTEVDKTLVEELADPMVHLVRNALDHGIEPPDVRREAGKSPTGTLSIRAFYEGNKVVIQIADDGKGIDPDVIRAAAIKKGLIDEFAASNLSDKDALKLIFAPGFSTAKEISDVSGRGVGMDVVNSKIQSVKGSVDIESEFGCGSTISIYLPLTLAIVQALIIKSNSEGFAVPIGDISEVIKFHPEDVHRVNDQDVIKLRGEVLPLFYLNKITRENGPALKPEDLVDIPLSQSLNVAPSDVAASLATAETNTPVVDETSEEVSALEVAPADVKAAPEAQIEPVALPEKKAALKEGVNAPKALNELGARTSQGFVVVVKEGTSSMGVVTDQLVGQEEAVVKAISNLFDYNPAISGATITGDGHVHMILDIPYLMKEMNQLNLNAGV